jgi:16S rRNA G1207 methylase RsmC
MPRIETEAQRAARYAAKDVLDKLGVKPGDAVLIAGAADADLVARARTKAGRPAARSGELADVILYWPRTAGEVTARLRALRKRIVETGGIWVISAKRGMERSGRPYLASEVIALGLAAGLVDNKICTISERDTAMRFVVRRADRRG